MTRCACGSCRFHDRVAAAERRAALLDALERLARRPSRRCDPVGRAALTRHVTVSEAERGGVWSWLRGRAR